LVNPEVRAEYDSLAPEFEIAAELVKARLRAGPSQTELARRIGTSHSAIARPKSGQTLPSTLRFLQVLLCVSGTMIVFVPLFLLDPSVAPQPSAKA
jgi:transcriptional regulator with XRE-family HTH domain